MNDTLIHANIFFFITTIAVILITLLLILILVYVVKIVRAFSYIANTLKKESENVAEDIAELRGRVREETEKVSNLWKFATGFFLNKVSSRFTSGGSNSHSGGGAKRHAGRSKKASHSQHSQADSSAE